MTTYTEIKSLAQALYSQWVGSGRLIESDAGSPTFLAQLLDLVHFRISGYSHDFEFLKETGTITLTGATSYNLKTLFPDLVSVYQIYGLNDNQSHPFQANYEANVVNSDGWSVRGNTLYFSGNLPTTGTVTIQYKSSYLVKTTAGVRQRYFTNSDDYSVVDNINVLVFGLGDFIQWRADESSAEMRDRVRGWYKEAFDNILLENKASRQLDSMY